MKFGEITVIGIIYVSLWVGLSIASVGQMTGPSHPYEWTLPLNMLCVVGGAFAFGYIGRMQEEP